MHTGMVQLILTGADVPGLLSVASNRGIVFSNVEYCGVLSVRLHTSFSDYRKLRLLLQNKGGELKIEKIGGMYFVVKKVLKRPVLLLCILAISFLTLWLPTRVLFVAIEGNTTIPAVRILQQAEKCGICFGANRSYVRSEKVKNSLLEAIPQLQWAGINTFGCTAVISVREESLEQEKDDGISYSSIIAERDGIVVSCTVTSGSPQCSVGQAVKEGQTLVSGYQDFGLLVKLTRSQAEVYALTDRDICVVSPRVLKEKGELISKNKNFSLIVGKIRINLSKDSGISYAGCDKIYREYYLSLPGGFVVPLAIAVDSYMFFEEDEISLDRKDAEGYILNCADTCILDNSVSGRILSRTQSESVDRNTYTVSFHYTCVEMIGREYTEEIKIDHGKND